MCRFVENPGAHHRGQCQRYKCRDENCAGDDNPELAEETAREALKKNDGKEYSRQRDRRRDDCEINLLRPLVARLHRRHPLLDFAVNVLQDDDGVIDHNSGGEHDSQQSQNVEREPRNVHDEKRPNQRDGNCQHRDHCRPPVA